MTEIEKKLRSKIQFGDAENLYSPVSKVTEIAGNFSALRFMGKTVKYKALAKQVERFAVALKKCGLEQGEAVTFALPNIPESVYLLYAISKAGFICSPLHPLSTPEAVKKAIRKTGSRIIFALDGSAQQIANECTGAVVVAVSPVNSLKISKLIYGIKNRVELSSENIVTLKNFLKNPSGTKFATGKNVPPTQKNTAVLLQSGGTTGEPKIIELSHAAVNNLAAKGFDILGIDSVSHYGMLSVLPVFHGFGLAMGVHAMLCNGGKNVLFPKFRRAQAIKEIKRGNVQFIIGVPRLYEALLSHKNFSGKTLSNLITAFVGGDFVAETLIEKFNAHIAEHGGSCKLFEGYGLTETVTVCAVNTTKENRDKTVGKPIAGIEIAAFDLSSQPKKLPPLSRGELCVCGDTLMNGYLGDRQATNDVFFTYEGRRFVKTGDCGYVDGDGFIHFVSRFKRIIKVRGIPVYPKEIEQLCLTVDGITGACVIPTPNVPDSITLFVETKNEEAALGLSSLIESKISVYAKPDKIITVPEFPYTSVGKIDTVKLMRNSEY